MNRGSLLVRGKVADALSRRALAAALLVAVRSALLLLMIACTTTTEVTSQPSPSTVSPTATPLPTPTKVKPDRIRLPDLTSKNLLAATKRLEERGFKVQFKQRFDPLAVSYARGIVIDQRPGPGDVRPGRTVTLFVQPLCTPGYSPCLAPALDYDCYGGTGDGPKYTGFHTVTGFDPYGLDGNDNDGRGCE